MKQGVLLWMICALLTSCSHKMNLPAYLEFKKEQDSIQLLAKNHYNWPIHVNVLNKKTDESYYEQLKANEDRVILRFRKTRNDTSWLLKHFDFKAFFGDITITSYDTTHNYTYPFSKGYQSKIIQGYDGNFTHFGRLSAKTLDFDMKVGDTVVAAREGIVVKKLIHHNKQGVTKDYRDYGNYLIIYHDDNTFSQYVHLKQYGNLVDVGERVKKHQPIALSGFTGQTTVPHLHFGVYVLTKDGLKSIPIVLESQPAASLKPGTILIKE